MEIKEIQEKLAIMYQEGFDAGVKAGLQLAISNLSALAVLPLPTDEE